VLVCGDILGVLESSQVWAGPASGRRIVTLGFLDEALVFNFTLLQNCWVRCVSAEFAIGDSVV
jgi:hypothetical protein